MSFFKCKMCGGTLEVNNNETVGVCEYCGTKQTLPKLDNERKSNLYDRANHFRRNDEFDKAMSIYEQILNEDRTDAESYWSIVLCRYGIEYVEDPTTHKRIPTVNRTQLTSIFDDEDYKSALQYADTYQREIYENEANTINEIQKGILAISQKEEPFDVFICYKETDKSGGRTQDSVLAQELYYELVEEGFKVFFAKITLEDKLGQEYEPYIFAALNSAKVMVVLGTKPEHFNAVWVKNEWSRYLALIKKGENKMLIPAYRDMDPYDLPEEFSHLQAQDMSKLGFMQDLVRGIKKIVENRETESVGKESVVANNSVNATPLLERAFLFLEDGDWESADEYCEKVLDIEPKNAMAYLGKLMAELWVRKQENLRNCAEPFWNSSNYQKVLRFGDETLRTTVNGYNAYIKERNENARLEGLYASAIEEMNSANTESQYKLVAKTFESIKDYKDSKKLIEKCMEQAKAACEQAEMNRKDDIYNDALFKYNVNSISDIEEAVALLESIPDWRDASTKIAEYRNKIREIQEENKRKKKKRTLIGIFSLLGTVVIVACIIVLIEVIMPSNKYKKAVALLNQEKYEEAVTLFDEIWDYKDSRALASPHKYAMALEMLNVGKYNRAMSYLMTITDYKDSEQLVKEHIGKFEGYISAGNGSTVGLKSDGTVVATGFLSKEERYVSEWKDIISISAGMGHFVGIKSDGTVVATGNNRSRQCNVSHWVNIVSVSAGNHHTIGLESNGRVVDVGQNNSGQCNVWDWPDVLSISAGGDHTVGLKSDGTVVAVGSNSNGQCEVSDWRDIVYISAGESHTVGLKSDGTVVAIGSNSNGQCEVSDWRDIIYISAGESHTVGLKSDGTVVAVGANNDRQCSVSKWRDIVSISAGGSHTVGLKSDGTVVAAGNNSLDECAVEGWNLFE